MEPLRRLGLLLGVLVVAVVLVAAVGAGAAPASETDIDLDGVPNVSDNCVDLYNPDQGDADSDSIGDRCDETPGLPASQHRIVVYPRSAAGSPRVGGCVIFTQYNATGHPAPPVNSCDYLDESLRNRSFQDWVFDPDSTRVDVEIESSSDCGGETGTTSFSFVEGANDYVDPCVDLAVSTEAVNEVVGVDERFRYHVTIENDGPGDAGALSLTDVLPDGVEYVSADGLPCGEAGGVVRCTAAELAADAEILVDLVVKAPDEVGAIVNQTSVASAAGDLDLSNNSTSVETQVGTGADLALATYAEQAAPGEEVRFWVSVWNDGPQSAQGVVVEDTLPEGVALLSATPSSGACSPPSGRRLTCPIGTIAAFDMVEVEVVVSGVAEGALTNSASVTSTAPADPELGNNSDTHTMLIGNPPLADLAVSNEATSETVGAGERFSYYLTVDNNGPASAVGVTLTDKLPAGVTYVAGSGLPCTEAGGVITCTAAELEPGGSVVVELLVTAPDRMGTIVNEARVASQTGDFDQSNNAASLETGLGTGADLVLAGYAEGAGPDEDVHFVLSVWNDGPQSAQGVVVEDTLPEGVALRSATPSAGTCSAPEGRRLTCSIGSLAAFDSAEIEIVMSGIPLGVLTNVASVTSTAPADADIDNNRNAHAVVVGDPPLADLAVYIDGPAEGTQGSELVYALSVENVGPETALNVRLTDQLGPGVTFVSAANAGGSACTHAGGVVSCELGDVAAGDLVDVALTVRAESAGLVKNTAEVVAAGPADPEPASNTSTAKTQIAPVATPPPPPVTPPSPPVTPPPPPVTPPPVTPPAPPARPKPKAKPKRKPAKKVTLCHKGKTIKVPKSQVRKHRKHGDKLGACPKKPRKR